MTINLNDIVSKQVPDFVRSDHSVFVDFLKAYYEYLNQYESRDLLDKRDIDKTLDNFIQYFRKELNGLGGEDFTYINERLFLRKIKPLFKSKGTESAYKFLFRVLYNKVADISYPWDSVLKASDGRWNQDMSLFIDISAGDANNLPGNRITISGTNVSITVFVTRVKYVRNNIYEVFIDKNYFGSIQTGYTINFNGITGTLIPTTTKITIIRAGEGFKVGDLIEGTTISGGQTITQLLKVTSIDSNGGITGLVNISFGAGYEADFFLLKSNTVISSTGASVTIDKGTTRQYSIPDDTYIPAYEEYGYMLDPNYYTPTYGAATFVGTIIQQFYEETGLGEDEDTNFALVKFDIGAVAKYQGYYSTNDGFLDDDIFLQDSYFYQKYSYLVTVDEALQKYKTLAKTYLHPSGTALFGEYQIQNNFLADIRGSIELGEWQSRATFTTINSTLQPDSVIVQDTGGIIRFEPYDSEIYFEMPPQVYTLGTSEMYNPPIFIDMFGEANRNIFYDNISITDAITITSDEQDINLNLLTLGGGTVDMNLTSIPTIDVENDIGINDFLNL